MLSDWKACKDIKETLRQCLFKRNQIEALVPDKREKKLIIKKRARYCAKTRDASCFSQFRKELAEAGVDSKQIDTDAKLLDLTRASNKI
ncbi:16626_t:CDS:2 [Cetraspora pellucida]|uniref:16626_t:CDS:1 n=1 Tax=Cetraspora pellucida TaxID=1433469 RepID=A0ACA9LZ23_9GLOM|nr:16626_t:CDS:2 [Cetraspora pellucida]